METYKFMLLNKVFCERMVRMLEERDVVASYEVCTDHRWRPIGQTLLIDGLNHEWVAAAVREVTDEYMSKYSLAHISWSQRHFLLENLNLSTAKLAEIGWYKAT